MGVSDQSSLNPGSLRWGIYYRYLVYVFSRVGGSVVRCATTGWRPLFLWLVVSIVIVFAVNWLASPVPVVAPPVNLSSSALPVIDAGNGTADNLSGETVAITLSGNPGTRTWQEYLGNITGIALEGSRSVATQFTTANALAIGVLFVLGFTLYNGYRSRRQVVIGEFSNYIGSNPDNLDLVSKGTGPLLQGELHRLRMLYSEVDDRRAIASVAGRTGSLDYGIKAIDPGDAVENAVSQGNSMKIGPIEFPVGAVAGMFNKVFSGPRLVGDLHRDGDLIIINAFMSGSPSRSWRVEGRVVPKPSIAIDKGVKPLQISTQGSAIQLFEDNNKVINFDIMVKELACRIFTSLTEGGTDRWRATYAFTEGLRDYRSCLLSPKDRIGNLKRAERRFMEAVSEDNTFDLAWYNLGVVYTELDNPDAAEKAFLKAIAIKPERWEPYYALGLNRFKKILNQREYIGLDEDIKQHVPLLQDTIASCKQAIALDPKNPHLHILIGVCYRMLAICSGNDAGKVNECSATREELFKKASVHHRKAVTLSWHALCADSPYPKERTVTRVSDTRKVSATALWDLARTYYSYETCRMNHSSGENKDRSMQSRTLGPIESVLRQAYSIDRTNTRVLYNLGVVCYHRGEFKDALSYFETATQIDPKNLKYWTLLALSAARAGNTIKKEIAIKKVLESPDLIQKSLSEHWQNEILQVIPREGCGRSLIEVVEFTKDPGKLHLPEMRTCFTEGPAKNIKIDFGSSLALLTPEYLDHESRWNLGFQSYSMARSTNDFYQKAEYYLRALEFLSDEWKGASKSAITDPPAMADQLEFETRRNLGYFAYHIARQSMDTSQKRQFYARAMDFAPEGELTWDILSNEIIKWSEPYATRSVSSDDMEANWMALESASSAFRKNPLGFQELYDWGAGLYRINNYKQALFAFESAILVNPYDPRTLLYIAQCYSSMAYYCQKREDKDIFWNQAIHYFLAAKEMLKGEVIQSTGTPDIWDDTDDYTISFYLGTSFMELSEFGKASSNFYYALQKTDSEYSHWTCSLKLAEALYHKGDYDTSEVFLSDAIRNFEREKPEFMVELVWGSLTGEYTFAGELYIKALLGQAHSFAERDAGLEKAKGLVETAGTVLGIMKADLENTLSIREMENTAGISGEENNRYEIIAIKNFLEKGILSIKAEISDKRGWILYKQGKDLVIAKKELSEALALKANADYYYHLAHVCDTLSREGEEKEREFHARLAQAYCDHALDMAPRRTLEEHITTLMKKIVIPPQAH